MEDNLRISKNKPANSRKIEVLERVSKLSAVDCLKKNFFKKRVWVNL